MQYATQFKIFEWISIWIFSIEFILRNWTSNCDIKYKSSIAGRLRYFFSWGNLIDLMAILPFFLPLFTVDLRILRMIRILRFLRFFKLGRYLKATQIVGNVFKAKKEQLVLCIVLTVFLIVLASSAMYFIENEVQPQHFSSIPATMWWSVTTLTTVGYGDVYPVTALGRLLTAFISILGLGLFALPAGILASGFSAELDSEAKGKKQCPHCHQTIE